MVEAGDDVCHVGNISGDAGGCGGGDVADVLGVGAECVATDEVWCGRGGLVCGLVDHSFVIGVSCSVDCVKWMVLGLSC